MRILLIVDTYVPARISGALQMHDLAKELSAQGHAVSVVVPSPGLASPWAMDAVDGVPVLRVRTLRTKDVSPVRRAIAECLLPYALLRGLRRSPLVKVQWEGIAWYSPSIFFGPLVRSLKARTGCRAYLILRDLFPDWAVDTGVMRKGLAYYFFKWVERYQYEAADVIGVQAAMNIPLVHAICGDQRGGRHIEVLDNWLSQTVRKPTSVAVARTPLKGRTIFVYAGNMGVAQGMHRLMDLAVRLRHRRDMGFLFIGRGSELERLRAFVVASQLDNVVFVDEVDSCEIPAILEQCEVGLVALDSHHTTHNIPGKLLSYLQAGLPVLAIINAGNDLEIMINAENVGRVCVGDALQRLQEFATELADDGLLRRGMGARGKALAERRFSSECAARRVVQGLTKRPLTD